MTRTKTTFYPLKQLAILLCAVVLASCGGGGGFSDRTNNTGVSATNIDTCTGFCAEQNTNAFLSNTNTTNTTGDVQKVLAQAVAEARARNVDATIAVTDRSGNVLAVLRTSLFGGNSSANNSAPTTGPLATALAGRRVVTVGSASEGRIVSGGLERLAIIPDELAAISKAVTASYLSSEGNAFTTRTASFIVQEHFIPGEADDKESGPLFGVQFTQLACSDLNNRFIDGVQDVADGTGSTAMDGTFGPKRSPLGLSADPGGIPLYKFGTPVGGVGVISDGIYGLDKNSIDIDSGIKLQDEVIALAATFGFAAPPDRRAGLISLDGRLARFTDAQFSDLQSVPNQILALTFPDNCDGTVANSCNVMDANNMKVGELVPVQGYYIPSSSLFNKGIGKGVQFTKPESGFVSAALTNPNDLAINNNDIDAFVLVDDKGVNRFPPKDSQIAGAGGLKKNEVVSILRNVIMVANKTRAQIRRPLSTPMRATVSVVDANGVILGISRTRDGPVFGIDTSLQKARTATFFSHPNAAADLADTDGNDLAVNDLSDGIVGNDFAGAPNAQYRAADGTPTTIINISDNYVGSVASGRGVRGFLQDNNALTGTHAFADRSGGNLSRPFFPDGVEGIASGVPNTVHGPLSKPFAEWSPFSTGLQLDLVMNNIVQHVLFAAGASPTDVGRNCSNITRSEGRSGIGAKTTPLANGIQIFPGSVPIYRNGVLIGGVGVSGDGVDQDDLASFLGLYNASLELGGAGIGSAGVIGHAPKAIRADTINIPNQTTRLRYVQCPQTPFIDSDEQNVCGGK